MPFVRLPCSAPTKRRANERAAYAAWGGKPPHLPAGEADEAWE